MVIGWNGLGYECGCERTKREFPRWRGDAAATLEAGLFTQQDGDDECAFRKCGNQKRLHEHFAGGTGVATHGFTGFESDESEGDGGTECGTQDGDVSFHVYLMCWCLVVQGFGTPRSRYATVRLPKLGSVAVLSFFVSAHQCSENGGEQGEDERLDGAHEKFEEIEW